MNPNIISTDRRIYITKLKHYRGIPYVHTRFFKEHITDMGGHSYWLKPRAPRIEKIATLKVWAYMLTDLIIPTI